MKIAAIIPSRYSSTRFEGKPLVPINGITMIERVYRQVEKSNRFAGDEILVATDDNRIANEVRRFGGNVAMTSPDHQSGTDRIWEVIENHRFDAAINIQGDEPVVSENLIAELYNVLATGKYDVVTPVYRNGDYRDYLSVNVVKAVVDRNFQALYFSRSPIPFANKEKFNGFYQHVGMYGYLKRALEQFVKLPKSQLEGSERLEQLRFLDNNIGIKTILSEYRSIGVDVPEDVARVEEILRAQRNQDGKTKDRDN
jgi:3-deoxy-manno-octulosonate cytidylyltransferase (CMP-KDO synthetase)